MEMDMQITIAGGCGDFGRSCFFVEGGRHAFIVDAGTSTDGLDRVPDLTAEQVARAEYLFVTHSHRDHTGAIGYFESLGFAGSVLLTNQTYRQMKEKPGNTMILDSTAPELELERDFSFRWGRSGHCAGSVWYDISCEGKNLFFSGDYRSDDPFYVCDDAEGKTADVAVLDAAYPGDRTGADMRRSVLDKILELVWRGEPLLLPVPHFGRGLSIAAYFRNKGSMEIPVHMAPGLYDEWLRLGRRKYFARREVLALPNETFSLWDGKTIHDNGIYFLTDAQLSRSENRKLIERHPELSLLMTGSIHGYGKAKDYYESGRAELVLWPNHMTEREMWELAGKNHFRKIIPYHSTDRKPESDVFSL